MARMPKSFKGRAAPLANLLPRKRLKTIHLFGERDVELGHPAGAMRRQRHLNAVVNIRPIRVMIELLRHERRARHEGEGLVEALEFEAFADRIAFRRLRPAWEFGKRGAPFLRTEQASHGTPCSPPSP